ncbi:MAG: YugN family protein [Candidatus Cohnella colombiensis]|uniref:YugN family protein n=1 Tax=Candidatus Cohnella colombiensis TaxID=3121368 RepID=A0AA95JAP0_9BACL|nr:MAG: YugN family protein [Cohnella sp.]
MLHISSELEGKQVFYGNIRKPFEEAGFQISNNWEYRHAYFDSILFQNEGVTIYLRIPAEAIEGKFDQDEALVQFGGPFLIKHIVHTGNGEDDEDFSMLDVVGLNQFQKPLDPDDRIKQEGKWLRAGEEALNRIKGYVH